MRTQEVAIKSTPLRVILKPDAEVLQEVVVTGMQKMDKRLFTGAADQLAAANVKIDGMPEISRALEGRSRCVCAECITVRSVLLRRFAFVELLPFTVAQSRCGS